MMPVPVSLYGITFSSTPCQSCNQGTVLQMLKWLASQYCVDSRAMRCYCCNDVSIIYLWEGYSCAQLRGFSLSKPRFASPVYRYKFDPSGDNCVIKSTPPGTAVRRIWNQLCQHRRHVLQRCHPDAVHTLQRCRFVAVRPKLTQARHIQARSSVL